MVSRFLDWCEGLSCGLDLMAGAYKVPPRSGDGAALEAGFTMQHILVLEDEELLRHSVARSLASLPEVSVTEAGNFAEAMRSLDAATGLDHLGPEPARSIGHRSLTELSQRGFYLPIIYDRVSEVVPRASGQSAADRCAGKASVLGGAASAGPRAFVDAAGGSQRASLCGGGLSADRVCGSALGAHRCAARGQRNWGADRASRSTVVSARDPLGNGERAFFRLINLPGSVVLWDAARRARTGQPQRLAGQLAAAGRCRTGPPGSRQDATSSDELPPSPASDAPPPSTPSTPSVSTGVPASSAAPALARDP